MESPNRNGLAKADGRELGSGEVTRISGERTLCACLRGASVALS